MPKIREGRFATGFATEFATGKQLVSNWIATGSPLAAASASPCACSPTLGRIQTPLLSNSDCIRSSGALGSSGAWPWLETSNRSSTPPPTPAPAPAPDPPGVAPPAPPVPDRPARVAHPSRPPRPSRLPRQARALPRRTTPMIATLGSGASEKNTHPALERNFNKIPAPRTSMLREAWGKVPRREKNTHFRSPEASSTCQH